MMGIAVERLATELTKLPADTWDRIHAQHPIEESRIFTNAAWDEFSERLDCSQMATDTHA